MPAQFAHALARHEGCVVMFTNRGAAIHQIQGPDFLLGEIGKDQSWAHTYATPGNFDLVLFL